MLRLLFFQEESETKFKENLDQLICDELNVKKVIYGKTNKGDTVVELDTTMTDSLLAEGQAREIVRKIQEERKRIETRLDEKVSVTLEAWPVDFESYIKMQAMVTKLTKGDFAVKRIQQ